MGQSRCREGKSPPFSEVVDASGPAEPGRSDLVRLGPAGGVSGEAELVVVCYFSSDFSTSVALPSGFLPSVAFPSDFSPAVAAGAAVFRVPVFWRSRGRGSQPWRRSRPCRP